MDWTAVGALAALISAAFAAGYTYLTYRLVRSQKEPHVIVYVCDDDSRPTILQIVIANIGGGVAFKICFDLSQPISHRVWDLETENVPSVSQITEGPLVDGIRSLAPGDSRKIDWGQFPGLFKAIGDSAIAVDCRYEDRTGKLYNESFPLEVRSFKTTNATGSEGQRIIAELRGIKRPLEQSRVMCQQFSNGLMSLGSRELSSALTSASLSPMNYGGGLYPFAEIVFDLRR